MSKNTLLIKNARVVKNEAILEGYWVYCVDGRIEDILPEGAGNGLEADITTDASGMYLCPGFIDLHIHGTENLLAENGRNQLEKLSGILPKYGVTGFLPAVCPAASAEEDIKLLSSLSGSQSQGAQILGFLLEGHFLARTGAIRNIGNYKGKEYLKKLVEALHPYKAVFGISPELDGITELLPLMTEQGYPAFITHTQATVEETEKAIKAGALHATHFYDVFPYPGEKDPGVRSCGAVEAILASTDASVDFILDGEHVHPVAVKLALACKGRDRVSLITDANVNAGLPPGKYKGLGGADIEVAYEGGPARMAGNEKEPGLLAGSGLTMDAAFRNAVKLLGADIPLASAMTSSNPARVLGLHNRKGFINRGYDADMVLLDRELRVAKCWVGGKCRFSAE